MTALKYKTLTLRFILKKTYPVHNISATHILLLHSAHAECIILLSYCILLSYYYMIRGSKGHVKSCREYDRTEKSRLV